MQGAFAQALSEGASVELAGLWASAAAAIKCTKFGGRSGCPDRVELAEFLEGWSAWDTVAAEQPVGARL